MRRLKGHREDIITIVFSTSGELLASGNNWMSTQALRIKRLPLGGNEQIKNLNTTRTH